MKNYSLKYCEGDRHTMMNVSFKGEIIKYPNTRHNVDVSYYLVEFKWLSLSH